MQILKLAENVSAVTVAAQTAVNTNTTPFGTGRDIALHVVPIGATTSITLLIEGSDDNSTFVTLATHSVLYEKYYAVKSRRYMRANITAGAAAGTYSVTALNGA